MLAIFRSMRFVERHKISQSNIRKIVEKRENTRVNKSARGFNILSRVWPLPAFWFFLFRSFLHFLYFIYLILNIVRSINAPMVPIYIYIYGIASFSIQSYRSFMKSLASALLCSDILTRNVIALVSRIHTLWVHSISFPFDRIGAPNVADSI